MRKLIFSVAGVVIATLFAWGGLLAHGAIVLNSGDSQWDRDPGAADLFFGLWVIVSILGGIVGWWLAGRAK